MKENSFYLKEYILEDLIYIYNNQRTPLSSVERNKIKGIYPYYGANGIIDKINDYLFDGEYILLAEDGTVMDKNNKPIVFYVSGKFWVNNHAHVLKAKPNLCNELYLFYALKNIDISPYITGSVQLKLNQKNLRKVKVHIPSLKIQKSIANILSTFDKKIQINNKINEKLETLAQTLYKHWFVDFEFPNEEGLPYKSSGGKMVETELGIIPEGWTYEKLGNSKITKLLSSGIKKFSNEKIYLATADVSNYTITNNSTKITYSKRPSRANMQPGSNTLWFAKMKDSKKLVRVSNKSTDIINNYIFSTGFAGLSVEKYLNYVWSFLLSKEFNELKDSFANGTTQQAINNKNINLINLLIPSENILKKFELLTQNIFDMIEKNWMENQKLANLRDLLLPKLMSGEIRVPIEEE